jgi:hypothetical protein
MLHITVHILQPSLAPSLILFNGMETGQRPVQLGTSAELPSPFVEFPDEFIMAILSAWQAQVSGVHGSGAAEGAAESAAEGAWMFGSEILRLVFLLSLDREARPGQCTR